jgi:signal transduction histidine kinase
VRLRLSDNGPGIAEQDYYRVLKPFTQGNEARTGGGSGLGLAIVAKIVSQHHGTIRLGRSELGLAGGDPAAQEPAAGVDGLNEGRIEDAPFAVRLAARWSCGSACRI